MNRQSIQETSSASEKQKKIWQRFKLSARRRDYERNKATFQAQPLFPAQNDLLPAIQEDAQKSGTTARERTPDNPVEPQTAQLYERRHRQPSTPADSTLNNNGD